MPGTKSIEFAESALIDLEEIRAWYFEQGVAAIGVRLVGEIVGLVEQLAAYPESGRIVPEFGLPAVRELIYPPFLGLSTASVRPKFGLCGCGGARDC